LVKSQLLCRRLSSFLTKRSGVLLKAPRGKLAGGVDGVGLTAVHLIGVIRPMPTW
jgi:hypothetical protein